jgi:hypothetical protein
VLRWKKKLGTPWLRAIFFAENFNTFPPNGLFRAVSKLNMLEL